MTALRGHHEPPPTLDSLTDLATPWCVHVVATLGVPEHLAAGPRRIDDLAAAANVDAGALGRVLRHLVSCGVFEEPEPGRFALNDAARALSPPRGVRHPGGSWWSVRGPLPASLLDHALLEA